MNSHWRHASHAHCRCFVSPIPKRVHLRGRITQTYTLSTCSVCAQVKTWLFNTNPTKTLHLNMCWTQWKQSAWERVQSMSRIQQGKNPTRAAKFDIDSMFIQHSTLHCLAVVSSTNFVELNELVRSLAWRTHTKGHSRLHILMVIVAVFHYAMSITYRS